MPSPEVAKISVISVFFRLFYFPQHDSHQGLLSPKKKNIYSQALTSKALSYFDDVCAKIEATLTHFVHLLLKSTFQFINSLLTKRKCLYNGFSVTSAKALGLITLVSLYRECR